MAVRRPGPDGVGGREVEPVERVDDAVAGEVEQYQVVVGPVGEQVFYLPTYLVVGRVGEDPDGEVADRGVLEHRRQPLHVLFRGPELVQRRVVVRADGDEQRVTTGGRVNPHRTRHRSAAAVRPATP